MNDVKNGQALPLPDASSSAGADGSTPARGLLRVIALGPRAWKHWWIAVVRSVTHEEILSKAEEDATLTFNNIFMGVIASGRWLQQAIPRLPNSRRPMSALTAPPMTASLPPMRSRLPPIPSHLSTARSFAAAWRYWELSPCSPSGVRSAGRIRAGSLAHPA